MSDDDSTVDFGPFYFHAVAWDHFKDTERDLYAHGEAWSIRDALDHFESDLTKNEYLVLIEEIDADESPENES